jgi:hypothetical protein
MPNPDLTAISFTNFVGGINTVKATSQLAPNEFHDAQNTDLYPLGGFSKRGGTTAVISGVNSSGNTHGFYSAHYGIGGGKVLNFLVTGTKLYSITQSFGAATDITSGLVITDAAADIWSFDILNDLVVLGNGVDTPIQIDPTPAAGTLLSGLPFTTFKFPVQFRGYMFYFVPTVSGSVLYDRVYFSSINDPTTVGANNFIDIAKGSGGGIQGAIVYNGYLYVFKRSGIYQIIYQPTVIDSAGDLFPFIQNPNPIVSSIGTQSNRSLTRFSTPATHATPGIEYVFFVDQFGIPRVFDGTITMGFESKIGTSTDSTVTTLASMDLTKTSICHAVNYQSKNRIMAFLSKTGGSSNDTCWILDYTVGFSIMRYRYFTSMGFSSVCEQTDGTFRPYLTDFASTIYKIDTGVSDDQTSSQSGVVDYIVTGDTNSGDISMQLNFLEMHIRGITAQQTGGTFSGSGTGSVDVSFYIDGQLTPFLTNNVPLSPASGAAAIIQDQSTEIRQTGKTLRIKMGSHDTVNDALFVEQFSVLASARMKSQLNQI